MRIASTVFFGMFVAHAAYAAQPNRAGVVVMSWGETNGNPAYSGVTFGTLQAVGPEVENGGDPVPIPAMGTVAVISLAILIVWLGLRRSRRNPGS